MAKVSPEVAEQMGRDVKNISEEMASPAPRRKWYELSIDGLKDAAKAVGEVGKPLLETAIKLASLLMAATK